MLQQLRCFSFALWVIQTWAFRQYLPWYKHNNRIVYPICKCSKTFGVRLQLGTATEETEMTTGHTGVVTEFFAHILRQQDWDDMLI